MIKPLKFIFINYILYILFQVICVRALIYAEDPWIPVSSPMNISAKDSPKKLLLQTRLNSSMLYLDNADLNQQEIDKQLIISLRGDMDIIFQPSEFMYLNAALVYCSMLSPEDIDLAYLDKPADQFSGTLGNTYFRQLSLSFVIPRIDSESLKINLGRHLFLTNNFLKADLPNYILPDQINGLSLQLGNLSMGFFDILGINILDLYQYQDNFLNGYSDYPRKETSIIGDFNGDVLSFQSGLLYSTPDFLSRIIPYRWKFFLNAFFTRFGPVYGGIESAGISGNYPDNDYVFHYGAGTLFNMDMVQLLLEISRSDGIDRKLPDIFGFAHDIKTSGYFFRSSVSLLPGKVKSAEHLFQVDMVYSEGPSFNEWGEKINYGYVSSGNFQYRGLLLDRLWGYRPNALILNQGISNKDSYGFYHSSGALHITFRYGITINDLFHINLLAIFLFDTSNTEIFPDVQSRYSGNENNIVIAVHINPYLTFSANAGIFFPGKIYETIHHRLDSAKKDPFEAILFEITAQF